MSIVLTEIRGDRKLARLEFKQTTIKIGRDPVRNNLAFERTRWPMVSRLHAEIRVEGGHWYLTDAGSRYGTLLNGLTINAATEIQSGAIIQLGRNGPITTVEVVDDAPAPSATAAQKSVPVLICQSGSSTQLGREYVLSSNVTLVGRDAAADISIEAAGAVVSRQLISTAVTLNSP